MCECAAWRRPAAAGVDAAGGVAAAALVVSPPSTAARWRRNAAPGSRTASVATSYSGSSSLMAGWLETHQLL